MSTRMTTVRLKGVGGFSHHGVIPPQEAIAQMRTRAQKQLSDAQRILAATDEDFTVDTHDGVHVWSRVARVWPVAT